MRWSGSTNKRKRKLIAGHGPGDDSVRLAAGRSSPAIKPAVRGRMTSMHSTRDVPECGKPVAVNLPLDPSRMANQRTDNKGCNNRPGRKQAAPRRAADRGVPFQARRPPERSTESGVARSPSLSQAYPWPAQRQHDFGTAAASHPRPVSPNSVACLPLGKTAPISKKIWKTGPLMLSPFRGIMPHLCHTLSRESLRRKQIGLAEYE